MCARKLGIQKLGTRKLGTQKLGTRKLGPQEGFLGGVPKSAQKYPEVPILLMSQKEPNFTL